MNTIREPAAFTIRRDDINALVAGKLGLEPNEGSAFFKFMRGGGKETELSGRYGELLEDPLFLKAIRIAARPDAYVVNRIGGGSVELTEIRLYRSGSEGEEAAAVQRGPDGTLTIQLFAGFREYLAWWMENFAGEHVETAANRIPGKITLEQFLYILHAVDCFRRVSYRNLLDHAYTERAHLTLSEFADTMAASVKSMDIRWLLPAFMTVLPGFENYPTQLVPEDAAVLFERGILENAHLAAGGEVLVFGEAGQLMGLEFFRSWVMASGFALHMQTPEGFTATDRFFVAPTALTNHFVRLEGPENGKTMVRHEAYTAKQLAGALDKLFGKVFAAGASSAAAKTAAADLRPSAGKASSSPAQGTAGGFCHHCGAKVSAGASFCAKCGTKLQ